MKTKKGNISLKQWMHKVRHSQQLGRKKHQNFLKDEEQREETRHAEREESQFKFFKKFYGNDKDARKALNKNRKIKSEREDKKMGIK